MLLKKLTFEPHQLFVNSYFELSLQFLSLNAHTGTSNMHCL